MAVDTDAMKLGWFFFDRWTVAMGAALAGAYYIASGNKSVVGLAAVMAAGVIFTAYSNRFWREVGYRRDDR